LEVWNTKLVDVGERLADERVALIDRLRPVLTQSYADVAGRQVDIEVRYQSAWREAGLGVALRDARTDELRRGISLVGPHRDDVDLAIDGLPARTHASQGEQRSLALALRLASHDVVSEGVGEAPILLLDDVFSELDPARSHALVDHLPKGQAVLTTASGLPEGTSPEQVVRVDDGRLSPA
jgi:DNA replication and repair protein RecF